MARYVNYSIILPNIKENLVTQQPETIVERINSSQIKKIFDFFFVSKKYELENQKKDSSSYDQIIQINAQLKEQLESTEETVEEEERE